jgi:hypothetical protein
MVLSVRQLECLISVWVEEEGEAVKSGALRYVFWLWACRWCWGESERGGCDVRQRCCAGTGRVARSDGRGWCVVASSPWKRTEQPLGGAASSGLVDQAAVGKAP